MRLGHLGAVLGLSWGRLGAYGPLGAPWVRLGAEARLVASWHRLGSQLPAKEPGVKIGTGSALR